MASAYESTSRRIKVYYLSLNCIKSYATGCVCVLYRSITQFISASIYHQTAASCAFYMLRCCMQNVVRMWVILLMQTYTEQYISAGLNRQPFVCPQQQHHSPTKPSFFTTLHVQHTRKPEHGTYKYKHTHMQTLP